MRHVEVGKLVFGIGKMKICVPVCAQTRAAAVEAVREIRGTPADLIEWRLDYFTEDILTAAPAVLEAAGELPLLCTFRTKAEGGEREIDPAAYFALNEALGALGVPMLDLELALCLAHEARAKQAIDALHARGAVLVLSSHDFEKTPPRDVLVERYRQIGKLTRVRGGAFGSVMTFASKGKASAPGQIDAETLASML